MPFELDERLRNDTVLIQESQDCMLLMMKERRYPWFILVPKIEDASEWHDLDEVQQIALHRRSVALGKALKTAFDTTKINIAALGNVVKQLHIHVIGRNPDDAAWPGPVWGALPPLQPMDAEDQQARTEKLKQVFRLD